MASHLSHDRLVTSREAQHLLGVGVTTLYKFCRLGRLKPVKFSRRCTRFRLSEVLALMTGGNGGEVA
jgi:predicted DNA-binding transcriptional regulator AlpA